jgi:hypothetical protein
MVEISPVAATTSSARRALEPVQWTVRRCRDIHRRLLLLRQASREGYDSLVTPAVQQQREPISFDNITDDLEEFSITTTAAVTRPVSEPADEASGKEQPGV